MNTRFRTAKTLPIGTFVLLTNQQQIDGVSKKLIPLKTGPYVIIEKPNDATYILQDKDKKYNPKKSYSTKLTKRKTN